MNFEIDWIYPSKGNTDVIETSVFQQPKDLDDCIHTISRAGRLGPVTAHFSLSFETDNLNVAILNYAGQHTALNKKNGVVPGQARITFEDDKYEKIMNYEWRADGDIDYYPPTVDYESPKDSIAPEDEGDPEQRTHIRRERSWKLRNAKIEKVIKDHSALKCEVCNFDYADEYGEYGEHFAEVHHLIPIKHGVRETNLDTELAVLCANCHRMIHRTKPMQTVEEFRDFYRKLNPSDG